MRDFRNWLVAILVILALVASALGNVLFAQKVVTLQDNLCSVINASKAVDAQQVIFYSRAADRAILRAKTDTGTLRQADLDAAAQDNNLVRQYSRGVKFQFPGCS